MTKHLRIITLVLVLVLALSALSSCDISFEGGIMNTVKSAIIMVKDKVLELVRPNAPETPPVECEHIWYVATCTEPQTCSVCAETRGEALGHTLVTDAAVTVTCTTDGKSEGSHCSVCNAVIVAQETTPALGHDKVEAVTKQPACTEKGEKSVSCTRCEMTRIEDIAPIGHAYADVVTAPTCTEGGHTTHTCTACGYIYTDAYVDALGHTYERVVTTAPTCTAEGLATYTCHCGHSYTETVAATGHTYTAAVTAPTCTEQGYTTYTCHCGHSYKDDYVNATGHTKKDATCTEAGKCTVCGVTLDPALTHKEVIDAAKAPTCEATGLTEGKHCERCGEVLVAQTVVDALGHTEAIDAKVDPTCTETGLTEGKHCSVCNKVLDKQVVIPAKNHDYTSEITTAPTCTEKGVKTFTCQNEGCGHTYTEEVAPTGHEYNDTVVAPTCTADGYTLHACKHEGCTYSYRDNYVDSEGHKYTSKTVAPTCTEMGYTEHKCSVCAHSYKDEYVAVQHQYNDVPTKPTCIDEGYTTHICSKCGDKTIDSFVDALGHTEVLDAAVAPTCTETGLTEGKHCSVCGHVIVAQTVVDALGHTEESISAVAPTCTETGLTEGKHCSVCKEVLVKQELVDALGHTEESISAVAPTCTATGLSEGKKCSVCGEILVAQIEVPMVAHTYTDDTDNECNECGYIRNCLHASKEVVPGKAATCTESGLTDGEKCSVCGETTVAQEVIDAKGHTVEKHDAKVVTCTEDGWGAYETCSVCEYNTQVIIEATGHTPVTDAAKAPTCEATGLTEGSHCGTCGEILKAQETVKALGHTMPETWTVEKAATCTEDGSEYRVCSVCGQNRQTQVIDARDHDIVHVVAKVPTCTEIGWDAYEHCTRCDYTTYKEIEATGHSYTVVTVDPTCTADGSMTYTCHCGHTYTEKYGDAKGHTVETDEAKAPTCTETGLTEGSHCSECGHVFVTQETVDALDHDFQPDNDCTTETVCSRCTTGAGDKEEKHIWKEWQTLTNPTCSTEGTKVRYCDNPGCQSKEDGTIPALEHNWADATCTEPKHCTNTDCSATEGDALGHTWVDATCTTPKTCSVCNDTEGDVAGHAWVETVITPATHDAKGKKSVECSVCHEAFTRSIPKLAYNYVYFSAPHWEADGARFAAYFFVDNDTYTWVSMTKNADGVYECIVPEGYTSVIFCRMNGSTTDNNWDNKWNQTSDLAVPTDCSKLYTMNDGEWSYGTGSWSTKHQWVEANCLDPETCAICGATQGEPTTTHNYHLGECEDCFRSIKQEYVFDFGENGDASHKDGSELKGDTTYTLDNSTYSLVLTSLSKVYGNAFDAKGNSALKLGTGSVVASMTINVPEGITTVKIYISGYKDKNLKVAINGTVYEVNTHSDDGVYTEIVVDTTDINNITLETQSSPDERAMIDKIEFIVMEAHDHVAYTEATCTAKAQCAICGEYYGEMLPHTEEIDAAVEPTCKIPAKTEGKHCSVCKEVLVAQETLDTVDHNYVDGKCEWCQLEQHTCVDANLDIICDGEGCGKYVIPAADTELSISAAITLGSLYEKDTYTTEMYYLTGVIKSIDNTTYGNMYIEDEAGNKFLVYGLYTEDGTKYGSMTTKPIVGDTIRVYGVIGFYSESQMKSAVLDLHTPHTTCTGGTATCTAQSTCDICGKLYGEALGHELDSTGTCTREGCDYVEGTTPTPTTITGTMHIMNGGVATYIGPIYSSNKYYTSVTDASQAVEVTIEFSADMKTATIKIGDKYIAPASGNTNGIRLQEYEWAVTVNNDGSYKFLGQGSDTSTLSFNKGAPRFQGYKNQTVSGGSYPCDFFITPTN